MAIVISNEINITDSNSLTHFRDAQEEHKAFPTSL